MNRLSYILVILLVINASGLRGQQTYDPVRWVGQTSFGSVIPLQNISKGYITDNLMKSYKPAAYWQGFSTTFFVSRWGASLSVSISGSSKNYERQFNEAVEQRYSLSYVHTNSETLYSSPPAVFNIAIGPAYKIERNKFILISKLLFGVNSMPQKQAYTDLKLKGTNDLSRVDWTSDGTGTWLTVSPSFTLGYRVTRRIIVDLDFSYKVYRCGTSYDEITTNLNSGNVNTVSYDYSGFLQEVTVGLGVMIVIK